MPTLSELVDAPPKIGCYGTAGSGKSAFWATLGDACGFIETDPNGYTTLKYLKDEWYEERQKVEITYFEEKDPSKAVAWANIKNYVIELSNRIARGQYKKQVVVFDTLTSMGEFALRSVRTAKGLFRTSTEIQEWGAAMAELEQIIVMARSWPIPVVFLGHREVKEIDEKSNIQLSVIGQKLLPKVLNYLEEIYYATVVPMSEGRQMFCLQTVRSPSIEVKTRRNLPNLWDMKQGARKLFQTINHPLNP